jgi:glycosyltransferase involved in cell wall biosynthesis
MKVDGSGIYYSRLAKKLKERGHRLIVVSTGGPLVKTLEHNGIQHHNLSILGLQYSSWHVRIFETITAITSAMTRKVRDSGDPLVTPWLPATVHAPWSWAPGYLARRLRFLLLWAFSVIKLLKILRKERIGVIDSHSTGAIALAYVCSRLMKLPLVLRVSAPHFTALPPSMFKYIYPSIERIVAVSRECVNYITAGHAPHDPKITIMHNFVDVEQFRPFSDDEKVYYEGQLIKQGVDISRNRHKIALVSRLDKDKEESIVCTIRSMLQLAKTTPDIQLIVVGDGRIFDRIYESARQVNKKFGSKIIIISGHMDHVERILNLADIVVAVGGTAVEAMACGKPVIVAGHKKGLHGGSFGGVITPGTLTELRDFYFTGRNSSQKTSPRLIAQACQRLLGNDAWRKELGEFGRRFVMEECNINKSVAKIERMYFEAVAHARSR